MWLGAVPALFAMSGLSVVESDAGRSHDSADDAATFCSRSESDIMRLEWHVCLEMQHHRCGASRIETQGVRGVSGHLNLGALRRVGAHWPWCNAFLIGWETFEERHAGKRGHPRDARRRSRQHNERLGVPGKRPEGLQYQQLRDD
jgi:hypothetical protein